MEVRILRTMSLYDLEHVDCGKLVNMGLWVELRNLGRRILRPVGRIVG